MLQNFLYIFNHSTDKYLFQMAKMYKILHISLQTNPFYSVLQCYLHQYAVYRSWCSKQQKHLDRVRSEVSIVVVVKTAVFGDVTLCKVAEVYWHFRGSCCLHYQCMWINNPPTPVTKAIGSLKTPVHFYQTITHTRRQ